MDFQGLDVFPIMSFGGGKRADLGNPGAVLLSIFQ